MKDTNIFSGLMYFLVGIFLIAYVLQRFGKYFVYLGTSKNKNDL